MPQNVKQQTYKLIKVHAVGSLSQLQKPWFEHKRFLQTLITFLNSFWDYSFFFKRERLYLMGKDFTAWDFSRRTQMRVDFKFPNAHRASESVWLRAWPLQADSFPQFPSIPPPCGLKALRPGQATLCTFLKEHFSGCLTGSVSRAGDSWSQGHEFKPHVGHRAYLINKKKSTFHNSMGSFFSFLFYCFIFKFILRERESTGEGQSGESQADAPLSA